MSSEREYIRAIASRIERYCLDHPNAADTLDGVRLWWLAEPLLESSIDDVERALEQLVEQGTVTRRILADGTVLYFSRPSGEGPP